MNALARALGTKGNLVLVIRNEQMKAIREALTKDWIIRYLRKCYPERAHQMGAGAIAVLVEDSLRRARAHGFRDPSELRKYAHVTFLLGVEFERDSHFEWARKILADRRYVQQASRARALEDATLRHLKTNDRGS
jgi:hypothetical protein